MNNQVFKNNKYRLVQSSVPLVNKMTINIIPELNIKVKVGKRVYLLNRNTISKLIIENLSYQEKRELLKDLQKIKERNGDILHYLQTFIIGVVLRKESFSKVADHAF